MREYEAMDRAEAMALGRELWRLHEQDVELRVTLAKFSAGVNMMPAGRAEARFDG